ARHPESVFQEHQGKPAFRAWLKRLPEMIENQRGCRLEFHRKLAALSRHLHSHRGETSLGSRPPLRYVDLARELAIRSGLHPSTDGGSHKSPPDWLGLRDHAGRVLRHAQHPSTNAPIHRDADIPIRKTVAPKRCLVAAPACG